MPFCCECGGKATKKRIINPTNMLCNECVEKINNGEISNPQLLNNYIGDVSNDGMNAYCENFIQSMRKDINNGVNMSNVSAEHVGNLAMSKSVTELMVADNIKINTISNQPLKTQLDIIQKDLGGKIQQLDNRVDILEAEKTKMEEHNNMLQDVVINMQKCLNRIDGEEQCNNIIISGLSEGIMSGPDVGLENDVNDDKGKVTPLLQKLVLDDYQLLENIVVNQIGQAKSDSNRLVKVQLPSTVLQNEILNKASVLKKLPASWSKIYIKKDRHPVYLKENKRISKKMYDLKKDLNNREKNIRIDKGRLVVDGNVIDKKNIFC